MEILTSLSNIVSTLSDAKFLLVGATAATLTAATIAPKVGVGRSINLALRSTFFSSLPTKSARETHLRILLNQISVLDAGSYIVITGEQGVGKSCLIQTALYRKFGVVNISVESGERKDSIVMKAERELTNIRNNFWDLTANTKRVMYFYKLLFRSSPIVLISVPERTGGRQYADVTAATRKLVDYYGLRVIVDGSPNSLPPDLKSTTRQIILDIDFMPRYMIESEFKEIISLLKLHNLDDAAWKILGGSPSLYRQLNRVRVTRQSSVTALKDFLYYHLSEALIQNVTKSSPNTKKIIEIFRGHADEVDKLPVSALGLSLDLPNKVFREVWLNKIFYLVPLTPAVGLILHNNIVDEAGLNKFWDVLTSNQPDISQEINK